jgi:hypothetical protein
MSGKLSFHVTHYQGIAKNENGSADHGNNDPE